ncbi:MAG: hypothetical protein FRX49_02865 [Trebouxia sp. A1-2]|nr:MAG: hypothetical protein FRX49_02865 [Trebouxia sp. A1-2]
MRINTSIGKAATLASSSYALLDSRDRETYLRQDEAVVLATVVAAPDPNWSAEQSSTQAAASGQLGPDFGLKLDQACQHALQVASC